jgi:signal transduction histidine kinase/DNA-binding LacI/PurR family transcriptional regulator/AraC-like DNA-binding protein
MTPPTRRRAGRPTFGLLTARLDRGFHRAGWRSVAAACAALDANLVTFDGGLLRPQADPGERANFLFDLVDPRWIDGLLVWSSAIDWFVPPDEMEAFCRRFEPLPIVSIGRRVAGFAGVQVDNRQGMRDAVDHLLDAHGCRRVAFLRGPAGNLEEEERFSAYLDALAAHGLVADPRLISPHTGWSRGDGPVMVSLLVDQRGLRPGVDFQAIASVGDDMACGAIEALVRRGYRVPEDVAVVGFNDDEEGRAILPSLTTVRQPVERIALEAATRLLRLVDGAPSGGETIVPLELVVRRSCGCVSPAIVMAGQRHAAAAPGASLRAALAPRWQAVATEVQQAAGAAAVSAQPGWAGRLLEAFVRAVEPGAPQRPFFDAVLEVSRAAPADPAAWQNVLSALRRCVLPDLTGPAQAGAAEDLIHQARVLLAETAVQAEAYARFAAGEQAGLLAEVGRAIQSAPDRDRLFAALEMACARLDIERFCLWLDTSHDPSAPEMRLGLAIGPAGRIDVSKDSEPAQAGLFAAVELLDRARRFDLLALPLEAHDRPLGVALLGPAPRGLAVETLRDLVAAGLEGVALREAIEAALGRAEEANSLKSRFLASVSHELRTPLSLIVGTIDLMLRGDEMRALGDRTRTDLDRVHATAQHLSHLIGDVLDLASAQAGELRLVCDWVAVGEIVDDVARLVEPLARAKGLRWRVDVAPRLPLVWADRARLEQTVLNLANNAVKYTHTGEITLSAARGAGQEDAVVVSVTDTGVGVPPEDREAIFDEYSQSTRTARRGYGGMGLGLAISRRLIELHGGRLDVESSGNEGAGSTFFFTLPGERSARVEGMAERPGRAAGDGADRVAVVRSGGDPSAALLDSLRDLGAEVALLALDEAADPVAMIAALQPGAVVLDGDPTDERAWRLMRALKQQPETRNLPVVFAGLPGHEMDEPSPGLDFLSKPINGASLAGVLDRQGMRGDALPQTILVADDDPRFRDLHKRLLQSELPCARILSAVDGREALEILVAETVDLVLLDLMMPEVDGFGVLREMRRREATRRTPVIVLTAQPLDADRMAQLQRGVAAVLAKGIYAPGEVVAQVQAALDRSKHVGADAQRIARRAMAFIHEHYAESLSRQAIANHVAVNERYLTRCFHHETGLTPTAYLARYRIDRAKALLACTDDSITEIALATGFSSSSHFSRVFRAEAGLTPMAYRNGQQRTDDPT